MNKTRLQIMLSRLNPIKNPKLKYEQYPTPPDIASEILWFAFMKGDIEDKVVADFGTGNGILAIGSKLLGANIVYAIDIDPEAIEIARKNAENLGLEIEFLVMDIERFDKRVDTVLMNPPFGLQSREGDRKFLRKAFEVSDVVYTIHKIESHEFYRKFSERYRFSCELIFEFDYRIPAIYEFHEKRFYKFKAGVWRFERIT